MSAADFARASDAVEKLVAAIQPEQWTATTPCTDWNLRQLVDHLVEVNYALAERFGGPGAGTWDDPTAAYRASAQALSDALVLPGVLICSDIGAVSDCYPRELASCFCSWVAVLSVVVFPTGRYRLRTQAVVKESGTECAATRRLSSRLSLAASAQLGWLWVFWALRTVGAYREILRLGRFTSSAACPPI